MYLGTVAVTALASELNYLSSDTPPTEAELDTEVTRLNNLEPMRLLRKERNTRLATTDWRASSDLTLSTDWKTYRQALRDLPANQTPADNELSNITWPTKPS